MLIFYARCSTEDQNEARQLLMAQENGAEKIYLDKMSGSTSDRPRLQEMLAFVREGDTVMVESISRISRSARDLLTIMGTLTEKKVEFISLKEDINTSTPQGRFMLTVFGALAELERENIRQRQAEGIAIARTKGVYTGRKRKQIDRDKFHRMCAEWRNGRCTAVSIQRFFGISAPTFYARVKEWGY